MGLMLNMHDDVRRIREKEVSEMMTVDIQKTYEIIDQARQRGNNVPKFTQDEPNYSGQNDLVIPDKPTPKRHILEVCQRFIILFLISEDPKVMSLEFASKVINGTDFSPSLQKSKARRLYDVSNGNN